ncbi:putative NAD dependent epimerase/dehydratase family protein [Bradyrhizobium sp. ORS 278]|uniref:NAD-dependent epimerase/dehydratase family protein n=1 Tax=Bradyrhizobium sp. (strain ORS 278) TaxID=114615 RepID=UPI00015089C0|nr:NAD-dependent epimerase/dehydratase family protein [Bradyrhizobium sp. ORS 278]CAL78881.1 putative NAD dependent epimerase/dehydratase family protein [Bradyrhizobium sp. ORS 278]
MSRRILVTGGAGFIGSHLVEHLLSSGYVVTVLDDLSTGSIDNLAEANETGRLRLIEGSVLDAQAVETAMHQCDYVFHLAVQCVRKSLGKPIENHEINATGTLRMLEAARKHNIKRFVYCSSSEVYGSVSTGLLDEDTLCRPVTVYGAAKLAGELYTDAYHQTYGLPTVVVRPFNAYGPRAHERGDLAEVIPRFFIRCLNGLPPVIFGDGSNGRDFTYVTEVARGLALACDADGLVGSKVNIAYGQMISIGQVAAEVIKATGRNDLGIEHISGRPGDVRVLSADVSRARRLLGYRAEIDFAHGLRRYLDWFRLKHSDPSQLIERDIVNWTMPTAPDQPAP